MRKYLEKVENDNGRRKKCTIQERKQRMKFEGIKNRNFSKRFDCSLRIVFPTPYYLLA